MIARGLNDSKETVEKGENFNYKSMSNDYKNMILSKYIKKGIVATKKEEFFFLE